MFNNKIYTNIVKKIINEHKINIKLISKFANV